MAPTLSGYKYDGNMYYAAYIISMLCKGKAHAYIRVVIY